MNTTHNTKMLADGCGGKELFYVSAAKPAGADAMLPATDHWGSVRATVIDGEGRVWTWSPIQSLWCSRVASPGTVG